MSIDDRKKRGIAMAEGKGGHSSLDKGLKEELTGHEK